MKTVLLSALIGTSLLGGCASFGINKNVSGEFDCPAQEGFGCRSIESIRSMIVTGGKAPDAIYNVSTGPNVALSDVPKWAPDVVLKVHVASYVDSHGDFHDDSVVYVVARHGGWELK